MTEILRIYLLGNVLIQRGDQPITGLPSRAAEALLFYLVSNDRPITREKLAELLWADRTQTQAMTNLRTILTPLRRELGDYLIITRQTLAFNHQTEYWLDVAEFERHIDKLELLLQGKTKLDERDVQKLQAAINLYQGDFLEGFYLRQGRGFEEWAVLQRERLRLLAREGFRLLAHNQLETGHYDEGIQSASRWQHLAPYDEDACRTMMWLHTRMGERNAALQYYQAEKQKLVDDLGVAPTSATDKLFRYIQSLDFPPPLNLPESGTAFIGRESEITDLEEQISSTQTRVVTIVSPGGIGKTRLAIETARYLAERKPGCFLNGISFVPLASSDTPESIPLRIAEAIGFSFKASESPQQELLEYLRERETLLILDNFEQLIDERGKGITFLVEVLDQAPKMKLLITSREPLNLYEEVIFDLPGLMVPEEGSTDLEQYSAVALFIHNASRINRGFNLPDEETATVAHICRLVDGAPLAIELASVWVRHFSCIQIAAQIESSLDFLETNYRNVPARHSSLRAVFEHSWVLLSPQEQIAFAQLSIFQGGFTIEAAESITSEGPPITDLADKSLLQRQSDDRLDIHPLLRQFAAEKLAGQPKAQEAVERHAAFYIEYLSQQGDGETVEDRAAIRLELANIRSAWEWAAQHENIGMLARAAPTLHNFYSVQSWFQEGIEVFQLALEHFDGRTELISEHAALLGDLLSWKAQMEIKIGRLEDARSDLQGALTYLEQVDYPERRSKVLGYLAISHFYDGEYGLAIDLAEESRSISEDAGDQMGIAFALNLMGSCAKARGDYDQARQYFEGAVDAYRAMDDGIGAAMALNNLGNLAQAMGDYESSQKYYQECSDLFKAHDHIHGAATTLTNAGKLAMRQGKYEVAAKLLSESLEMKREINDMRGVAVATIALGDVSVGLGDCRQAQAYLTQGLTLALEAGDVVLVLDGLAAVATWMLEQEQTEMAVQLLTFVRDHKATIQETRERVDELLSEEGDQLLEKDSEIIKWQKDDAINEIVQKVLTDYLTS